MADLMTSVLIVDDQKSMVKIFRTLLEQIGFKAVDEAQGGPQALTMMRAKKYGLVISDWNMQPMSGLHLLKEVRNDKALVNTPFIIATGETRIDHVVAAKKAGADAYIVKPFTAQTLSAKVESVLALDPTKRHVVQMREAPATP
jgi:two-component system, chemotaxis family, chemotaxis protein CheY